MGWKGFSALPAAALAIVLGGTGVAYASGGWTAATLPATTTNELLYGSSCASATACVAVGFAKQRAPLILTWDGTDWARTYPPKPSTGTAELSGVSCYYANRCMAVGSMTSSSGVPLPFTEQRYGTGWKIQPAPIPSGEIEAQLSSIACPAVNWCMATGVGYTAGPDGYAASGLAEEWNGTDWTVVPMPTVGSTTAVYGVSCTSASFCAAVGSSDNSKNHESAVIESWDGTSWSVQPTPPPLQGAANGSDLNGVSCSAPNACTAVGQYYTAAGAVDASVMRWDGTTWAKQAFQLDRSVFQVSCSSATSCVALGTTQARDAGLPQLFHWNGTDWATVTTPNEGNASLQALGCSRAGYCTADGSYQNPSGRHPVSLPFIIAN